MLKAVRQIKGSKLTKYAKLRPKITIINDDINDDINNDNNNYGNNNLKN